MRCRWAPAVGSVLETPWSPQRHVEVGRGPSWPGGLHGCRAAIGPGPALARPHPRAGPCPQIWCSWAWGFSPQSPKGFLESYEEMLNYALRPETWATTRLELEGRGVSRFVPSARDPEHGRGCLC